MTWTGGGDDALWSNGANWGGTAPGAADTAVFDSTSAKACTVDVSQVLNLTITDDWTFDLAEGLVRPAVTHDATAKMISFICHRRRGLMTIVK